MLTRRVTSLLHSNMKAQMILLVVVLLGSSLAQISAQAEDGTGTSALHQVVEETPARSEEPELPEVVASSLKEAPPTNLENPEAADVTEDILDEVDEEEPSSVAMKNGGRANIYDDAAANKYNWPVYDSESSDSHFYDGSHEFVSYSDMKCDQLEELYKHEYANHRLSIEVCKMNITQYERLAYACKIHLDEENADVAELNDGIAGCTSEKSSVLTLIEQIKAKIAGCEATFKDLQAKVTAQHKINSDFLSNNLGLADQLGFCQDDIYDCQVDVNTCLDSCGHH